MAMFKDEPEKNQQETIIGADVVLTGNLKSGGNVQINGRVKGKIDTEADILIGETAQIDGSITSRTAVINGKVQGNIETNEDLEISPTGKIFGDVVTKNLIIKKGSIFMGKSSMPGASDEAPKQEGGAPEEIGPIEEDVEKEETVEEEEIVSEPQEKKEE